MSMKPSMDELKSDLREFHQYIMKSQELIEKVDRTEVDLKAHVRQTTEQLQLLTEKQESLKSLADAQVEKADDLAQSLNALESYARQMGDRQDLSDTWIHSLETKAEGLDRGIKSLDARTQSMFRDTAAQMKATEADLQKSIEKLEARLETVQKRITRNMAIQSVLLAVTAIIFVILLYR